MSFSTYLTPRRPEDSTNLALDRSNSALDHRQRFTFQVLYDLPFFKNGNWFVKNIVGNWEFARSTPISRARGLTCRAVSIPT
ncbi:MAG TPA: hypothetical protein VMU80_02390 [Bryobacteraceae bacterium]|nr:hypothetical protein [Bryobacteraceae bacterium]